MVRLLAWLMLLAACAASADEELRAGDSVLQLEFDRGTFSAGDVEILEWVRRSADIVSRYYSRFPASRATIRLAPQPGAGVHGGKSFANPNAYIRVQLGREVSAAELRTDWVLVHEMTHLALPDTGETHATSRALRD